jgi:hypothetical protein
MCAAKADVRFGPIADIACLIDYSVGAIEQRARHVQAKRFGGFEIDDKLEFDWLLDGQIGGLCSGQNLLHIASQTFGLENRLGP